MDDQNSFNVSAPITSAAPRIIKGKRGLLTIEAVLNMQKTHKTDAKIGEEFGITRQAVYQFRKKHGITFNQRKNQDRDYHIWEKYKGGVSGTKIASEYGLSISQTYRIINKMKRISVE